MTVQKQKNDKNLVFKFFKLGSSIPYWMIYIYELYFCYKKKKNK